MTWTGMAADEPRRNLVWILPVALICTSFGWWENYVHKDSPLGKSTKRISTRSDLSSQSETGCLLRLSSKPWPKTLKKYKYLLIVYSVKDVTII